MSAKEFVVIRLFRLFVSIMLKHGRLELEMIIFSLRRFVHQKRSRVELSCSFKQTSNTFMDLDVSLFEFIAIVFVFHSLSVRSLPF